MPIDHETAVKRADYLTREEVVSILKIKPETLYCYVSRGHIRSFRQQVGRASYYLREDVDRLKVRRRSRESQVLGQAASMRWGDPTLTTMITESTQDGPRYRSRLALDLVREGCCFENVAEYLWSGTWTDDRPGWKTDPPPREMGFLLSTSASLHQTPHVLQLLAQSVLSLSIAEGSISDRIRAGGSPVASARRMVRIMAGTLGFIGPTRSFVVFEDGELTSAGLARAFGLAPKSPTLNALNTMLVLAAAGGMDSPTIAARVAASEGVDQETCISAALSVHFSTLIGRIGDRVAKLFEPPSQPTDVVSKVGTMLHAARSIPGFDPHFSAVGDPRTNHLIDLAHELGRSNCLLRNMSESIARIRQEFDVVPTIETGLVMVCRALKLPDHSASGILALGRTVGWLAHVFEQRLAGFMIVPRSKFKSGVQPR